MICCEHLIIFFSTVFTWGQVKDDLGDILIMLLYKHLLQYYVFRAYDRKAPGWSKLFEFIECFRNSADTEFRIFFSIPYIPYTIGNCSKFRGIMRNSVLWNSSNSAEFRGIP